LIFLTTLSFVFLFVIIILEIIKDINLPTALIIGVLANSIFSLLSLIGVFIKFVTDIKYLEAFKGISKSLLDYLSKLQNEK